MIEIYLIKLFSSEIIQFPNLNVCFMDVKKYLTSKLEYKDKILTDFKLSENAIYKAADKFRSAQFFLLKGEYQSDYKYIYVDFSMTQILNICNQVRRINNMKAFF